jgi:hypothetical protein
MHELLVRNANGAHATVICSNPQHSMVPSARSPESPQRYIDDVGRPLFSAIVPHLPATKLVLFAKKKLPSWYDRGYVPRPRHHAGTVVRATVALLSAINCGGSLAAASTSCSIARRCKPQLLCSLAIAL